MALTEVKVTWMALFTICLLANATALPVSQTDSSASWKGQGRTRMGPCNREQWEQHDGFCSDAERQQTIEKYAELKRELGHAMGDDDFDDVEQNNALHVDDMQFDFAQIDELLGHLKTNESTHTSRSKRSIRRDFHVNKWNSTIYYTLDGSLGSYINKGVVLDGISMWTEDTCLDFVQVPEETTPPVDNYLVFGMFGSYYGCSSYIGRSSQHIPQPIYLNDLCLYKAVIAHEIAHALGVIHEHQRADRDAYINIHMNNVYPGQVNLFTTYRADLVTALDTPYDYASAMHYYSEAFAYNEEATITTKDERFQATIGQRVELSFMDKKLINLAYCADTCTNWNSARCQHQGYPSPRDCSRCVCPDGWSGRYCETLQTSTDHCNGGTFRASATAKMLSSPGHSEGDTYSSGDACTWLIQAAENEQVVVNFTGAFRMFSHQHACHDWVEIRHNSSRQDLSGPRYCGRNRPNDPIFTGSNNVLVLFRAKSTRSSTLDRDGFSLQYYAVNTHLGACASSPCADNERCVTTGASYRCECVHHCDIDECDVTQFYANIRNKLKLVIGLDSSRRTDKFASNILDMFRTILCSINRGAQGQLPHSFAAVSYSSIVRLYLNLEENLDTFITALRNNYFILPGGGDIFNAVTGICEHYFKENQSQGTTTNIIIVQLNTAFIQSNSLQEKLAATQNLLRKYNLELIVITIELSSDDISLVKQLAGNWNVFDIDSFSDLNDIASIESRLRSVIRRIAEISSRPISVQTSSTTIRSTSTTSVSTTATSRPTTRPTTTTTHSTTQSTTYRTIPRTRGTTYRPTSTTDTPTTSTTSKQPTSTTRRPTTTSTTSTTTTTPSTTTTTQYQGVAAGCYETTSACSQCGGCGYRVVDTYCSQPDGRIYLSNSREEDCTEACVIDCSVWIGRLYPRTCKICTCNQAVKVGDECILLENLQLHG